ncbi:MAG TPA: flagellar hook protein FlgE [Acidobacteriaceae bacterium]|nr:flagellar hook protein FlgE [Acidobacteriaceae bacterium]
MSAFSIPLSGLAASSDALNVIANNLSNLNTDGYKEETLNFADVFNQLQGVSGNGDPIQIGSGVHVAGQTANYTNGTVNSTGISSNLALQGNGFFVVENGSGQMSYTRDGAFSVNSQGELCTAQGQLVLGYPAVNGVVSTSVALAPINVNQAANIPAVQTSTFSMDTNLNAGSAPGDSYSTPLTVYDSLGTQQTLTVNFTNTAPGAWNYSITLPAAATGGTGSPTTLASGSMTFDSSGNLTSPASPITGIQVSGLADGAAPMSMNWTLTGPGGVSYITQQTGTSATTSTAQNGYGVGTLTGYSVLSDGTVQGQFSNNQTMALGRIAVASFANNQGLSQLGNNDLQATFASGSPVIGQAGAGGNGTITGGAVEESNVNLSAEFANMIVAQQSYDANAKVLTTMNQVSQATIQMVS